MERVVHVAKGWDEADRWDRAQNQAMTADERRQIAKILRERVYGTDCPDVRESGVVTVGRRQT